MSEAATELRQWMVSARARGEVLTTSVRAPGIELVLLGASGTFEPDEMDGWLRDLVAVSRETAAGDPGTRPIPALLHHLLTGLLFSHSELWSRGAMSAPLSMAFVRIDPWVGFGWIGGPAPDLWLDDHPVSVEWVKVRDQAGNEARSLAVDVSHRVRLHMSLSVSTGTTTIPATLDAAWVPDPAPSFDAPASPPRERGVVVVSSRPRAAAPPATASTPRAPVAPVAPPRSAAVEIPPPAAVEIPWPAAVEPPPQPASPAVVPPAVVPPAVVLPAAALPAAAPPVAPPSGWDVVYEGEPAPEPAIEIPSEPRSRDSWWKRLTGWFTRRDRSRSSSGASTAAQEADAAQEWSSRTPGVEELPELIPPTPEPEELTSQTVQPVTREPIEPVASTGSAAKMPSGTEPPARLEIEPNAPPSSSRELPSSDFRLEGLTPHHHMAGSPIGPPPLPGSIASRSSGTLAARSQGPAPLPSPPSPPVPANPDAPAVASAAAVSIPASIAIPPHTESMGPPVAPAAASSPAVPLPASPVAGSTPEPAASNPARPDPYAPIVPENWAEPPIGLGHAANAAAREATAPPGTRVRVPLRPEWPAAEPVRAARPWWQTPWAWGSLIALLFLVGWMVGGIQGQRDVGESNAFTRMLRAIGLGGARFEVAVDSRPPGAWIAVDGRDLVRRTPTTIEVTPGAHTVSLSFSDLGGASFTVKGVRGDHVPLLANLWGSLAIYSGDGSIPVAVTVDGVVRGLVPVSLDSMMPGAHDIHFSGPGLQPWGQTVQVRVNETAQVVARPMTSPATGVIDVRSTWTDAEGSVDLPGAVVYIDAERRGVTPLTLELPRGPHSVRVESRGEQSSVQVIELPGGNQRFARFELGLGADRPRLQILGLPVRPSPEQTTVISANLDGVTPGEVRDMWLHVRQPEGTWRRYEMTSMKSPGGVVGSAVFPITLLDENGRTLFYVSSSTTSGDEYFTEILPALQAPGSVKR